MSKKNKLTIGFAGTPELAYRHFLKISESSDIDIRFVLTQPDKKTGRGQKPSNSLFNSSAKEVEILQPDNLNDGTFKENLLAKEIDLLVVVAYGKIVPDWMLSYPKYGCLNVHFSLLPKYRGAAPMQRAICNGDLMTGISFMSLVNELDAGPVYESYVHEIGSSDIFQLEDALLALSLEKINTVIEKIVFEGLKAKEQNHTEASIAEKIHKDEGLINWSLSSKEIIDKFRGLKKWPRSFFKLGSEMVTVHDMWCSSKDTKNAGEIKSFTKDGLEVFCSDGVIKIASVQFPGKKLISAGDFFNSKRAIISPGENLS
jgi:methionyl-tRNA formyltransferase